MAADRAWPAGPVAARARSTCLARVLRPLLCLVPCRVRSTEHGARSDWSAPASSGEHCEAEPGRFSEAPAGSQGLGPDALCGDLSSESGPCPGRGVSRALGGGGVEDGGRTKLQTECGHRVFWGCPWLPGWQTPSSGWARNGRALPLQVAAAPSAQWGTQTWAPGRAGPPALRRPPSPDPTGEHPAAGSADTEGAAWSRREGWDLRGWVPPVGSEGRTVWD